MARPADTRNGAAPVPGQAEVPTSSAIAGTAPTAANAISKLTSLHKRLLSAAVLLPLAVLALWLGGAIWIAFVSAFGLTMIWEWCAVCDLRRQTQIPWPQGRLALPTIVAMATGSLAFFQTLQPMPLLPPAWFSLVLGVVLTTACAWPGRGPGSLWLGVGLIYVIPACLAAMAIRAQSGDGLSTEVWIVALVVAADTGAYVAGRSIGGPKLAPRISPNKTWAGLAGAVLAAAIVGWVTATVVALPSPWGLALISGGLAIVEQAGDLFESFLKRHFGVKDSGRIIPGHGGVLDRVDGLLAVILAVAGIEFLMGGGILGWL
jgi:phosphatidate cytidylyltransferase